MYCQEQQLQQQVNVSGLRISLVGSSARGLAAVTWGGICLFEAGGGNSDGGRRVRL